MKYIIIIEHVTDGLFGVGPFDTEAAASDYARVHHSIKYPQLWRVAQLRPPGTVSDV